VTADVAWDIEDGKSLNSGVRIQNLAAGSLSRDFVFLLQSPFGFQSDPFHFFQPAFGPCKFDSEDGEAQRDDNNGRSRQDHHCEADGKNYSTCGPDQKPFDSAFVH